MNNLKTKVVNRMSLKITISIIGIILFLQAAICQSQQDMISVLRQKFELYTEAIPREDIFIHTDREEYIAGEELFFTVYVIDRKHSMPSLNSRIAYVEFLNTAQVPIVQKRIRIDHGMGSGSISISDTLGTALFTIRAYTNWMKNFPDNVFAKDIMVYNLLNGGMSDPKRVQKNPVVSNPLPKTTWNQGVTLTVNHSRPDSLELHIGFDERYRPEDLFHIFIQTRGNLDFAGSERIHGETKTVTISKSLLQEGINQITLFNEQGMPVAERTIYTPLSEDNGLKCQSADRYALRNQVKLELRLDAGNLSDLSTARLSISVAPAVNENVADIREYMILGTEFGMQPGKFTRGRKFSELSTATMDSILTNVCSNRIDWQDIISGNLPQFKYPMEKEDHFLSGQLKAGSGQIPDSAEYILLCSPGKDAVFSYVRTDHDGNFRLPVPIDDGLNDLIIMPDKMIENSKIVVESSFSSIPHSETADSASLAVPPYMQKWSVNYQVRKLYGIRDTVGKDPANYPVLKKSRFYGKPDFELIMADYINLPLMEEVFFEILPNVSIREKDSRQEIVITDRIDNRPYLTIPCLMIDGVIIKDPELIIDLDPELVEKIDVIRGMYVVGNYTFPGLVNVITKAGDFSSVPLPVYMIRLSYKVFDQGTIFHSPAYSAAELMSSRIPDFGNTLYWNPLVKLDANDMAAIEFWSSDNASDYVISILGITEDGKMISLKKNINVGNFKPR